MKAIRWCWGVLVDIWDGICAAVLSGKGLWIVMWSAWLLLVLTVFA